MPPPCVGVPVGSEGICIGSVIIRIGSARLCGYQHVVKCLRWVLDQRFGGLHQCEAPAQIGLCSGGI